MVDVQFNEAALDAIYRLGRAELTRRAEAVAAACNAESEWGGYDFEGASDSRHSATVWSADGRNDATRDERLVANIEAT